MENTEQITKRKREQYKIVPWVPSQVVPKIEKAILSNPELCASVTVEKVHPDGDLTKIVLRFSNCGRNQFHERLVSLMIKALL
jgi:hypothetical protein